MENEIININNPIPVKNKGWHLFFDNFIKSIKNYIQKLYNPINSTTANSSQSASNVKLPTWNDKGQITNFSQIYRQEINVNGNTVYSLNDFSTSAIAIYAPISAGDSGKILASSGSGAPTWIDNGVPEEVVLNSVLTKTLEPNKVYIFESRINDLTLTLGTPTSDIANEYHMFIYTGETAPTITFPDGISWVNDAPTIAANKIYEISILNNITTYFEL